MAKDWESGPWLVVAVSGTWTSAADFSMLGVERLDGRSMIRGVKLCLWMR